MTQKQITENLQQMLPLTPAVFFVLLCLTNGDKHGYAIMRQIATLSDNQFRIGPATLYTTLQRLLDLALIEEVAGPVSATQRDHRRRYYRLSDTGRLLLEAELGRMDSIVRHARRRKLIPSSAE
jgi:DNA-binding PadR family transcriptional regulator